MNTICNTDDTINSRDLCIQLQLLKDDLESEYEDFILELSNSSDQYMRDMDKWDVVEILKEGYSLDTYKDECKSKLIDEWRSIKDFIDEIESERGYEETYRHGVTLVHDNYFDEYIEKDHNSLRPPHKESWPYNHIDWVKAAKQRRQDFAELTWDGNTYLVERV